MKQHNYKEQLQNRTIKPSSDSWEKLNRNLTEHEKKEKRINPRFFKVASVILIFISVGFYFLKPDKEIINAPIIVSPSLKENLNNLPEINDVIDTEIAVSPEISTIKKRPILESNKSEASAEEIAFTVPADKSKVSINKVNDTVTEAILITEILNSEEQFIDDEVEQLLNKSKIKKRISKTITTRKT